MPFTVGSKQDGIPVGRYLATLERVEVTDIVSSYGAKEMRKWHFLLQVNGELQPLSALSTLNTSPGSKAYEWLTAILRRPLQTGEEVQDPIGQQVFVNVILNPKGYASVGSLEPYAAPEQVIAGVPR